ncbi:DEAD/DEAH box helicase [Vibrio methylphosphonaticus]|uniref:DEAD/DEAH box helicase n=1 Tax=Vibrio methylphosphonaticus TaxID=2946866 RepID=UPI00202A2B9F|nr:DEAD/DEAH box helicase [Vibrio methylphosphonaticus]MCL9775738.1 DEAD/DEAH box helicase [Vibrio methylphosphonaticus]
MQANLEPRACIEDVKCEKLSPFLYLKKANQYLSIPAKQAKGREYLIRALDQLELFESQILLLQNLIRKAGLYPYLKKYFSDLSYDKQLTLDLYQSNFDKQFIFHSMQAKIFNLLKSGNNLVLSAPTSMGKSAIIDALIAEDQFSKIVIVVPTIALIDETRRRIQKRFSSEYQVIHHGSQIKRKNKVVYILTQERVNERKDLKNIDLFIVDEFYKLAFRNDDSSRVIALNIALSKLLSVSKQFYMIGPYIDAIRGMEVIQRDYVFVPSEFNTVALNIHEFNIAAMDLASKNLQLEEIVNNHHGQTIIYCKSAASIAQVSRYLGRLHQIQEKSIGYLNSNSLKKYYMWLVKYYGKDWGCTSAIRHGIGIHHGALPRAIQQKNIDLFNSKKIKILICTSTLIEGVNTAAENIIIYDNRNGTPRIDNFTHKNISGRAGRMNQYLVGNVFCLEALPKQELQTQVVDLPLGQQDHKSPINLLAGIQPEHLSEQSTESLMKFAKNSDVPLEIIQKHSTYKVELILKAYELITQLSISDMNQIATIKAPKSEHLKLLSTFIKTVESGSLTRLNLHFEDNLDLQNRLGWYIYAENHSSYIKKQISFIYDSRDDAVSRSDMTDKELKITRNIFKHSVTRALLLLEDLLNFEFTSLGVPEIADLGYLVHLFEHSHLPTAFSALEEMGIPIETLDKLVTERLSEADIDVLVRYLRIYHKYLKQLNQVDHMFIKKATY